MKSTKINFRLPLFLAASVTAAVLTACGLFSGSVFLLIGGIAGAVIEFILVVWLYPGKRLMVLPIIFIFMLSYISALFGFNSWEQKSKSGEISFCLTDDISIADAGGGYKIIAVGKEISANGQKLKGRVLCEIVIDEQSLLRDVSAGDIITVQSGQLEPVKLLKNQEFSTGYYKSDIRYIISAQGLQVQRTRREPDFITAARQSFKNTFFKNIADTDTAAVSYAMITGDQSFVDSELFGAYSASGLVHVLSASGLHIGFLFAAIGALLSKIKGRRGLKFWLTVPLVLFYTAVCNFSVTIVRAAVMGLLAAGASALGRRYDLLNSLMISEGLMLLFKPLYLFDLSFLLSFSAVMGIALLYAPIERAFSNVKVLKGNLGKTLAMTIAANVGVFPVAAFYFNTFYVYGLLLNMVAIPVINVIFILMLIILVISLIIPPLGVLITVPCFLVTVINSVTEFTASLPYATLIVFSAGILWIFYFVFMFFAGGFVNANKRIYRVAALALAGIFVFCFIPYKVPYTEYKSALAAVNSFGGPSTVLFNEKGESIAVFCADGSSYRGIRQSLIERRMRGIDALIVVSPDEKNLNYSVRLAKEFFIKEIYVVTEDIDLFDTIKQKLPKAKQVFGGIEYKVFGAKVFSYAPDREVIGVCVSVCGQEILYPLTNSARDVEFLAEFCNYADIIVSRSYPEGLSGGIYVLTWRGEGGGNILSAFELGNFTIRL